jgi:thiamine kinase-like enzyme
MLLGRMARKEDWDNENKGSLEEMACQFYDEIVLTHTDCRSSYLMRPAASSDGSSSDDDSDQGGDNDNNLALPLQLIDYKYAGLNPRAADIANTFNEYCDALG